MMNQLPLYLSNNFIEWGQKEGADITPLKLQKLLYLYYARYCYTQKARPFEDCFVNWKLGPVLVNVYETTKRFGAGALTPLHEIDGSVIRISASSEPFQQIFNEVVTHYGHKTASELVNITHHGLPDKKYQTAWEKAGGETDLGNWISAKDAQEDGRRLFE